MSSVDTKAIRERLSRATPGPWQAERNDIFSLDNEMAALAIGMTRERQTANAALIAAAPTDLARLCDRVEELERALKLIASHAGKTLLGKGLYHDGANAAFNNMAEIADAALGETPP